MQKLSVAIITFNEEKNIGDCIRSVQDVADEIIVVDSLSTDQTKAIAEEMGAVVHSQEFLGHVQQKNLVLQQCQHPYVLSLDADERLDAEAIQHILKEKENGFPADGYIFKRLTHIGSKAIKYGSWYPDKKLRLVNKEFAQWEGINPHDSLISKSTNIKTLSGNILHFSYANTDELFTKTRKYAEISARHLYSLQRNISPLFIPFKAIGRFLKHYILKAGFLAGKNGWLIGRQQYCEAYWKYQQLRKLNKSNTSR